jgi:serine protease Do
MAVLDELQNLISQTAAGAGEAVVGLSGRGSGRSGGRGTGVVIADGRVLTAAHNLRSAEARVVFADERRTDASVLGVDPALDLAVLETDTGGTAPLPVWAPGGGGGADEGDQSDASGTVGVGTPVVALARPGGRGLRATLGFVSAAERTFRPRGRRVPAIEHTAPLPPGSSGGPLVDAEGHLLGINVIRLEGGLILAVATATLASTIERLARGETPVRRELGVAVVPPHMARRLRRAVGLPERDGVLIRGVRSGSPAEQAGLQRGDLILSAGGREASGLDVLHSALDEVGDDGRLELGLLRGTEEREVAVQLNGQEGSR